MYGTLAGEVQTVILLILTVLIEYRLAKRIFQLRFSGPLTFYVLLLLYFIMGKLNVYLHLAKDIEGNSLYYGLITFSLYSLLFCGSAVKKIFFTVMLIYGFPMIFYIFLPFVQYLFEGTKEYFQIALQIIEYISMILFAIGMEFIGKKFQNLKRDLPTGYTIYLTAIIIFVHAAVFSAYEKMRLVQQGNFSLSLVFLLSLFAVSGIMIAVIAIFVVDRQVTRSLREQLNVMQTDNFKSRELEWRKLSGFRHDMKNHLICLNGLLENGKMQQATFYMRNLMDTMEQFDTVVETGNDYADALLSVKCAKAEDKTIALSIDMTIPSHDFIEPVDLCCILSNAFDNAIAACSSLPEEKRWITATAFTKQGQFVMVVKTASRPM